MYHLTNLNCLSAGITVVKKYDLEGRFRVFLSPPFSNKKRHPNIHKKYIEYCKLEIYILITDIRFEGLANFM
jgi:hypothetical protein